MLDLPKYIKAIFSPVVFLRGFEVIIISDVEFINVMVKSSNSKRQKHFSLITVFDHQGYKIKDKRYNYKSFYLDFSFMATIYL